MCGDVNAKSNLDKSELLVEYLLFEFVQRLFYTKRIPLSH